MTDAAIPKPSELGARYITSVASGDFQRAFKLFRPLFVSAFLIIALIQIGVVAVRLAGARLGVELTRSAIDFVFDTLTWLPLISLALAVHRLVLLDEIRVAASSYRWRVFALWAIGLSTVESLLGSLIAAIGSTWLIFVMSVVFTAIGIRLSLILPSIAIDESAKHWYDRFGQSWSRTKGFAWIIFFSGIFVAFPFLLIVFVPFVVASWVLIDLNLDFYRATAGWVMVPISSFAQVVGVGIGAAVVSHVYRVVTRDGATKA